MANNIIAQVMGGQPQAGLSANTVGEVKQKLGVPNHQATVNGVPANDDQQLSDYQMVTLSTAIKGGC